MNDTAISLEADVCDTSLALGLAVTGSCGGNRKRPPLALSLSGDGRENRATSPPHSAISSYSAAGAPSPEVKKENKFTDGEGAYVDSDGGGKKKLRLTKEQSAMLENSFKEQSTLNPVRIVNLFVGQFCGIFSPHPLADSVTSRNRSMPCRSN